MYTLCVTQFHAEAMTTIDVYLKMHILDSVLLSSACSLTCEKDGTLNTGTCTCDCADGYSGDTCGSECTACM